jgi:integrase
MAARRSTGGVVEKATSRGTSYGIRFRALGRRQFVLIGNSADGVTREDAERELAYTLEAVRRGEWAPPAEVEPPREVPTFHRFATDWFRDKCIEGGRRGSGLSENGKAALRWALELHLLPHFAGRRLDQITVEDVDAYRRAKVREGRLNATSINKTLAALAAVLEVAVEYGHLERNPAKGRRRRLPAVKAPRTYLDSAAHVAALLDAAGALDREREGRTRPFRRPLLAVLTLAGLRIDEALSLRWRDVDLAGGRLKVAGSKTDAAARTVPLLPLLRDELAAYAAACRERPPGAFVFPTSTGAKRQASNVRRTTLAPAVERANAALAERGCEPLPEGLTPHSLRRTFASILVALGRDPAVVMRQMGHATAGFTLGVYAAAMDWAEGERERLRALVEGCDWALTGTKAPESAAEPEEQEAP